VIVVIGSPHARVDGDGRVEAAGPGAVIATSAAGAGSAVEVVGRVGEDASGDGALLDLARRRVGHVAVLRDAVASTPTAAADYEEFDVDEEPGSASTAAASLEAADLQLALRYLPEYRVIVVAEPLDAAAIRVVVDAISWSGAALVVVGLAADGVTLPDDATVFEPPDDGDPDGSFAAMVGAYAAGLDRGDDPRTAFEAAAAGVGSTAAD
jgi:hypothetical protein